MALLEASSHSALFIINIQMTAIQAKWIKVGDRGTSNIQHVCVGSLCPSQQFFSHVGTGITGLNQYYIGRE